MHRHVYALLDRINRTKSLAEVYEAALDSVSAAVQSDRAAIMLFDDSGVMRFVASKGLSDGYRKDVEDHCPSTTAIENPEPRAIADVEKSSLKDPPRPIVLAEGIRALALVPVLYSGKALGRIMVYFNAPHEFSADEISLLQAIAAEVAFSVERQRAQDALGRSEQHLAEDLAALTRVNQLALRFVSSEDLQDVLVEIVEAAIDITKAAKGNLQLFDPETKSLKIAAARGFSENWLKFFSAVQEDAAACAVAMKTRERIIVDDVRTSPIFTGTPAMQVQIAEGVLGVQSTPLVSRSGELLGMLSTHFTAPHRPAAHELRWLDLLARQAADLLARKRADDALRESEGRFRVLFERAPLGTYVIESGTQRILDCNERAAEALGYTREELCHLRVPDIDAQFSDETIRGMNRQVVRDGATLSFETRHRTKSGELRDVLITAAPIHVNGRVFNFATALDISERKRAEEAVRESEQRFRAMADNIAQFAWIADAAGSIFWYNKRWFEYTGTTLEEMQGWGWQKVHHPDHVQRVVRKIKQHFESGEFWEDTFPLRGKDGQYRWFLSRAFPIRDSAGKITCWFGTNTDITEQREAREALAQAHAELRRHASDLEQRVQQRTQSLNESLKSLETLLYTIAHDLRAPNRAMQGYAQLLAEGHAEQLDEEARFLLSRISQAALKNERLIRDLLEFGRLAHAEFPCRELDPRPAIASTISALEDDIKRLKASVEVAEHWPKVWANDSALGHVLNNLLSNALKYVPLGTRPAIRIFPKVLPPLEASPRGRVRICVEDSGIGIAPEQQQRIFEPFQRAVAEAYEGTGMGLAIVRKAAERMGGTAGVQSTPSEGSCFWIELLAAG